MSQKLIQWSKLIQGSNVGKNLKCNPEITSLKLTVPNSHFGNIPTLGLTCFHYSC